MNRTCLLTPAPSEDHKLERRRKGRLQTGPLNTVCWAPWWHSAWRVTCWCGGPDGEEGLWVKESLVKKGGEEAGWGEGRWCQAERSARNQKPGFRSFQGVCKELQATWCWYCETSWGWRRAEARPCWLCQAKEAFHRGGLNEGCSAEVWTCRSTFLIGYSGRWGEGYISGR